MDSFVPDEFAARPFWIWTQHAIPLDMIFIRPRLLKSRR